MSLLPTRTSVSSFERRLAEAPSRTRPLGLVRRLILFVVAFVILHGFCLFAVAQVARLNPGLLEGHQGVAALLCGEGTTLTTDFRPVRMGGPRGLDRWITCRDAGGQPMEGAGQIAALLSALVLSVPLGMVLFGWTMRVAHGPHGRAEIVRITPPEPIRWRDRLMLAGVAFIVSAVIAGASLAYVTQYHPQAVEAAPWSSRLLCGDGEASVRLVNRYSRQRAFACFDADGKALPAPTPTPGARLVLPVFLGFWLAGLYLVSRLTLVQRRRRLGARKADGPSTAQSRNQAVFVPRVR